MNISNLNPIGYNAETAKGNTYKKSNIVKSVLVGTSLATSVAELTSKNKYIQKFSTKNLLNELGVKNPKVLNALVPVILVADLGVSYIIGRWADKSISAKRAQKADSVSA